MSDYLDDFDDRGPRGVDLTQAEEGYRICEMCNGDGVTMIAKMYPTGHTEEDVECPECDGEGQIEDAAVPVAGQSGKDGEPE